MRTAEIVNTADLVPDLLCLLALCGSGLMTAAQFAIDEGNEESTESLKKRVNLVVARLNKAPPIPTIVSSWKKSDGTTGFAATMSGSQR